MSDKLSKQSNELAQVLNRINTLTQHGEDLAKDSVQAEDIPQLTEVYEGEPLAFISPPASEFPTLEKFVAPQVADVEAASVGSLVQTEALPPEKIEKLLAEMMPLIQAAVKKAVLQKLVKAEQPLCAKIEAEIMQTLRERLQSLS